MVSNKISSFYLFTILFLLTGWVWLAYNAFYAGNSGISVCHIKNLTGLPCPSCGITSSVTAILGGDFLAAWSNNPLGYLVLPALFTISFLLIRDLLSKRTNSYSTFIRLEAFIKTHRYIQVALAMIILINWTLILWK